MKKFVAIDIPVVKVSEIFSKLYEHKLALFCQILIIPEQEKCQKNETPMTAKIEISIDYPRNDHSDEINNQQIREVLEFVIRNYQLEIEFEEVTIP